MEGVAGVGAGFFFVFLGGGLGVCLLALHACHLVGQLDRRVRSLIVGSGETLAPSSVARRTFSLKDYLIGAGREALT